MGLDMYLRALSKEPFEFNGEASSMSYYKHLPHVIQLIHWRREHGLRKHVSEMFSPEIGEPIKVGKRFLLYVLEWCDLVISESTHPDWDTACATAEVIKSALELAKKNNIYFYYFDMD